MNESKPMNAAANGGPPTNVQRMAMMDARLRAALVPTELEILDESHLHVGHAGARDGRGHFAVRIVSERLAGRSALERHRAVYAALGDLMTTDIHAVSIRATAP